MTPGAVAMPYPLRLLFHTLYLALMRVVVRLAPGARNLAFAGSGASLQLVDHIIGLGLRRILLVTDRDLRALGLSDALQSRLGAAGVTLSVYDGVTPDPTFAVVDAGYRVFRDADCEALIAMGGGSVIDAAKGIRLLSGNPGPVQNYIGYFKLRHDVVPLYAIPTTAGTGSEATMGAVIADDVSHEKHIVADPKLLPTAVALDPDLMLGLPASISAATGMDALTHALEVYLSPWASAALKTQTRAACKLIFANLPLACQPGPQPEARLQMSLAAYYAGLAVGEVNVGNVHAIAHQLGGQYGIPHGQANAVVLPHVLRLSLPVVTPALALLADDLGLSVANDSEQQRAQRFIDAVVELNREIGISPTLEPLRAEDIPAIAARALKESNAYAVPLLMRRGQCEKLLRQLLV